MIQFNLEILNNFTDTITISEIWQNLGIKYPHTNYNSTSREKLIDTLVIHSFAEELLVALEILSFKNNEGPHHLGKGVSAHFIIPQLNLKELLKNYPQAFNSLKNNAKFLNQPPLIILVNPKNTAFHAGLSIWKDKINLNHCSIGIEFECIFKNLPQDYVKPSYSLEQINLGKKLISTLKDLYNIQEVVAHSDIAHSRPGGVFKSDPWGLLMEKLGLNEFLNMEGIKSIDEYLLREMGYSWGVENYTYETALRAFTLRFYSQKVKFKVDNNAFDKIKIEILN